MHISKRNGTMETYTKTKSYTLRHPTSLFFYLQIMKTFGCQDIMFVFVFDVPNQKTKDVGFSNCYIETAKPFLKISGV